MQPGLHKIQIEPTNRCNCRCVICRRSYWQRPLGDMSFANFTEILEQLPAIAKIHLQGQGEPLLNNDLVQMIAAARHRNIAIGLNTNASLLTGDLGLELLEAGVTKLNFSIDTLNSDLFSETRPGPPLSLIMENIERVASNRRQGNFKETSLAIAVVAKPSTIADLPEVVHYAADSGLDLVYVQNVNYNFDQYGKNIADRMGEDTALLYEEYAAQALAAARAAHIELLLPALVPSRKMKCGWPFKACNITWDGYVSLCCLQPDPDILHFGNIFEQNFESIWNSERYDDLRKRYRRGEKTICTGCPALFGTMWHEKIALLLAEAEGASTAGSQICRLC